jgi:hypothetical protein
MYPGHVQRLIGIDVAQTGDNDLVEQKGLDRSGPPGKGGCQVFGRWRGVPGIRPDAGQTRAFHLITGYDSYEAESAGIDETNLATVVQGRPEVSVSRFDLRRVADGEPARHPQVGHEGLSVVQWRYEELPLSTHSEHRPPFEPLIDLSLTTCVVTGGPGMSGAHASQPATFHRILQMAPGDLHFWQLGQALLRVEGLVTVPGPMEITPRPFGEILAEGMAMLARVWKRILAPAFWTFVIIGAATIAAFALTGADDTLQLILSDPQALVGMTEAEITEAGLLLLQAGSIVLVFQLLGTGFLNLTVHRIVASELAGEHVGAGAASSKALSRLFILIVAGILAVVLVVLGLFALIIPGLWLAGAFSMVSAVVALEDVGPVDALRRSFALVRGRWWPTVGFLLLVGLFGSLAAQLVQLVAFPIVGAGDVGLGAGLGFVVLVVAQGFVVAAIAVMVTLWYLDLRSRKGPLVTESLR